MPNFTTDGYVKKLEKMAKDIDIKPFYEVTNEIIARQENRIFNKGIGGNGSQLGKYSTRPTYISLSQMPRKVSPKGKFGETKFLNGKIHKSAYFNQGYSEYKKAMGKGNGGNVNLWLSGRFRKGFANSANPVKMITKGFSIIYSIKVTGANPDNKLNALFNKYPLAFKFTKGEKAYVLKRFREIFINHMRA
jgi:hypothetical protein